MAKQIFKAEINKVRKIASLFSFNLKMSGKTVILSEENQKKLKEARLLLEQAANILIEIK